jgi:hypothetical protein
MLYITWYLYNIHKYGQILYIMHSNTLPTLNKVIIKCTVHYIVHLNFNFSLCLVRRKVRDSDFLAWVREPRKMSQVLDSFGLLDFTMLRPVLAWRAFWNLSYTYFVTSSTKLIHTSHFTLLRFTVSTCFGHYLPILRRLYTKAGFVTVVCGCRCGLVSGCGKTTVKCVSSWYCLLGNYVTIIHGQLNIKYGYLFNIPIFGGAAVNGR